MDQDSLPVVSVITPSFNRVDLLPATLDSVLSQSYRQFEYIVVDDGSTDGTWEWLNRIDDPRVKVFTHTNRKNRGQSASINLGLRHASGRYVVILDSDDLLAQGALAGHVEVLDKNPSVGMVYGQGYAVDEGAARLYQLFPSTHQEESDPNRLLLDCYIVSPGLCMFRKSVISKVGQLEETFRAAQDHDFVLRIAEVSQIAYSGVECFYYRKHGGTISANGKLTRWQNGFKILERAAARYPYPRSTLRRRRAVLYFRLGQVYFEKRMYVKAIFSFLTCSLLDPRRAIDVGLKGAKRPEMSVSTIHE
ncbi:glycosyltransferase [Marinobacter sp. VGCF2001]|uniref:glycosyltransferase n=1 Tax=Marinobacter sp. VGCF2001 TaxID=3417189 RepID=UPI003CFA1DE9